MGEGLDFLFVVRLGILIWCWVSARSQCLVRFLSLCWITGSHTIHLPIEGLLPPTGTEPTPLEDCYPQLVLNPHHRFENLPSTQLDHRCKPLHFEQVFAQVDWLSALNECIEHHCKINQFSDKPLFHTGSLFCNCFFSVR